jgi:hypothetical protein
LDEVGPGHRAACHFSATLDLTGCDALGCAI